MARVSCPTESAVYTKTLFAPLGSVTGAAQRDLSFPFQVSFVLSTSFINDFLSVELAERLSQSLVKDWSFDEYTDYSFDLIMTYISKCSMAEENWRKILSNVKRMYQRKLKLINIPQDNSQQRAIDLLTYFYDSY